MPDLLLELFSEEIPARMQTQAAKDLERLVVGALSDRGLMFEGSKAFAGSRRLTLTIHGLPAKQPDVSEEKKGPRVNAPEKAIEGFLRSAGLTLEQCEKRDDGKGEFYVAVIARKGRATEEVLAEILPKVLAKLPWPKSMRFPGSPVRWVRPLQSILCTFDGEIVPFEFAGCNSGRTTRGHRFLSQGEIEVRRFDDYVKKLREAYVVLDAAERKEIILHNAKQQAFALGLELIEDEGLLEEVAGLAEWPLVLIGKIEDQFMDVPAEILQTSMRTHQKYFSLRHPAGGGPRRMANRFVVVSNMVAADGGKEIVAGNERVLRARLSDAKFFWDQDRHTKLADRVDALKGIVFHAKLGTQYERVERIEALAGEIAKKIGAGLAEGERNKLMTKAERAAHLCKADLTSGVVGEFPELQGIMGSYYAAHDGEDGDVAAAIREHYKPVGPSDAVPTSDVSIAVALADKFDLLASFFGVGEIPTGSGDPYALRRAALGTIRIILQNKLRLGLREFLWVRMADMYATSFLDKYPSAQMTPEFAGKHLSEAVSAKYRDRLTSRIEHELVLERRAAAEVVALQFKILDFFVDRLTVNLRERGIRHDLIFAAFGCTAEDDLVRLVARVEALQTFLKTEEGANLLAGYKRAANILKAEEKKDKTTFNGDPDPDAFVQDEEKALFVELATAAELVRAEIARERFVEAMAVMSRLRKPVDAFFDKVTVNDKDPALRKNRLLLLSHLRATLHLVADFSKIEG